MKCKIYGQKFVVIIFAKLSSVASRMIYRTRGAIHPIPLLTSPLKGEEPGSLPFKGRVGVNQRLGRCLYSGLVEWLVVSSGDGAAFGFGIVKHYIRHFMRDATLGRQSRDIAGASIA
jgi:hypothetical protein